VRISEPQWIRTTDLRLRRPSLSWMLLAEYVAARPAVLAPLALRAAGTLNAGRGTRARRARRRVLRLGFAGPLLLPEASDHAALAAPFARLPLTSS